MGRPDGRRRYHRHVELPPTRAAEAAQRARNLGAYPAHRRLGDQGSAASHRAVQEWTDAQVLKFLFLANMGEGWYSGPFQFVSIAHCHDTSNATVTEIINHSPK